jgi:hypothetical protein
MADFTPTQGRLPFIHAYTGLHGCPPAESEIATALCVSSPSVNQMVKTLEKKGFILRQPGQPRSIELLIPEDEIPAWGTRKREANPSSALKQRAHWVPLAPPTNLYVLSVCLSAGPISKKFANKEIKLSMISVPSSGTAVSVTSPVVTASNPATTAHFVAPTGYLKKIQY